MSTAKPKSGPKAGKAASIYDVARESRVSVFTVSAVVNNKSHVGKKLRERVEAAINKLNFRPNLLARSFAKQYTPTISMVTMGSSMPVASMVVPSPAHASQK